MRLFDPTRRFFRIVRDERVESDRVVVELEARRKFARCPSCRRRSQRVHSRYVRKAWDLPCVGRPLRLVIHARKFFCLNGRCRRRIFTERFPSALAPYARRTERSKEILLELAHLGSAENGARVARLAGFPVSPDTLIRMQRSERFPETAPEALGIDEFSWRKGRKRYGAVTVDLVRHKPMDLLPTDALDEVTSWLQARPAVTVMARDRDAGFALAARQALPQAVQVADRFHLVHNVHDAFQTFVNADRWRSPAPEPRPMQLTATMAVTESDEPPPPRPTPRKQELWEKVKHLREQGDSISGIARTLGISRITVRRYIARSGPPAYPRNAGRSPTRAVLESFMPYLKRRWHEDGVHNIRQLYGEVQDKGFTGGLTAFWRALRPWRRGLPARPPPDPWAAVRPLLLFTPPERWTEEERAITEAYLSDHPKLEWAFHLREAFIAAVRDRDLEGFLGCTEEAKRSGIPSFQSLARGLEQDLGAVRAALLLPWSNAQTEGQINRLKLLKRQGYGRAKPDLLRVRVLHRACAA